MKVPVVIRPAEPFDLPAINDIYNYYVVHSTATYQETPDTIEDRQGWFARHGPSHPVTVAVADEAVIGWASLSPFHVRSAYRQTVESSVYIDPEWHRRGIGRALMDDLIARARTLGHHVIVGGIDAEQSASLALHDSLGFVRAGHLREVGRKFGRWLDVVYVQLSL